MVMSGTELPEETELRAGSACAGVAERRVLLRLLALLCRPASSEEVDCELRDCW